MTTIIRWFSALLVSLVLSGCVTPAKHSPALIQQPAAHGNQPSVLLINSNASVERYKTAQNAFTNNINGKNISILNLQDNHAPVQHIQDALNSHHFDAIYGIGAKALGSVDHIAPTQPVVFSSVLNWRSFQDQKNFYGVSSDIAPASQLAMFKHFFPDIKSIAVMFNKTNLALVKQAIAASKELNLTLIPLKVESSRNLSVYINEAVTSADALWLIADPVILNSSEKVHAIFKAAKINKRPVFATNEVFAEFGATLTISADLPTVGRQAAILINNVIKQRPPAQRIQFPAGSKISLNLNKVEAYQLNLNYEALDAVNDLIE
ncbi:ABC transporter substrate-binding protein [Litoribacillus peritrichatus]|uniref:ABC transporter substrate-binding protein n=1 Tax=Litoribacillus peritrichatus TaxID=718191 RepID=A0ABP7MN46_9GAMM